MPLTPAELSVADVELLDSDTAYQGFFRLDKHELRHRLFAGGWGKAIVREVLVRPDAVGALLYDPDHDLVGLVEQFRIGALNDPQGPWCLEVVAGINDKQETPQQVIERELLEEADFVARELRYIGHYYPSPGGSDEIIHLYCALGDLSQAGGVYGLPEEGEDIALRIYPAQEVLDAVFNGRFNNAATLISLSWLRQQREAIYSSG